MGNWVNRDQIIKIDNYVVYLIIILPLITLKYMPLKRSISIMLFSILLLSFSANFANAESVPEWIKNNALWYGQGIVSETEFLNAIKFLIENEIIILESKDMESSENLSATVIIPNGNFDVSKNAFYMPYWNKKVCSDCKRMKCQKGCIHASTSC